MATTTTNYGLAKPESTDYYDVADQNGNMDIIDGKLKENEDNLGRANANALLRDLNIMLNLALGTSNIDAWADLFADASRINAPASSGFRAGDGSLGVFSLKNTPLSVYGVNFGNQTSNTRIGQTFKTPLYAFPVTSVRIKLYKQGSPTDNVSLVICETSGGVPTGNVLYNATNTVPGSSITTSFEDYTFHFSGVTLEPDTVYAISVQRSGSNDTSKMYYAAATNPLYLDGMECAFNGSTQVWTGTSSADLYFEFATADNATVIWSPVTATEPFAYAAIAADQDEGTGSVTWYLSDDGTNWTEVPALDAMQQVNFDAAAVYLKCVLTGNAAVSAVAWGGY